MTSFSEQVAPVSRQHLAHPKYRADIDGLRAIAVLSVVLFHAFPVWLKGGFIGVDIFFVISGYLISTIIFSSLDNGSFSFSEFYARRINRIFPALITVLSACCVFGWFVLYPDEYSQLGKHLAGGAGFISNIVLLNESGYFDTSAEIKPLLHLWSLGIEEQFYILWPLIMWAAWKIRLNALTIIIIAAAASLTLNISNINMEPSAVFYLPQTRIWELLLGSLLAYANIYRNPIVTKLAVIIDSALCRIIFNSSVKPSGAVLSNLTSILGFSLIGVGLASITKEDIFPGWLATVPVLGAVLIIAAGPEALFNKKILSNKIFVWFGLISFPLYLWHWPLLSFARIIESDVPTREVRISAVFVAIILAWLTFRLIERPLRSTQRKLKTFFLVAFMVGIGVTGFTIFKLGGIPARESMKSADEFNSQFVGPIWKYTSNRTCLDKYPFKESESYGWWFCIANKDEKPSLLLLGNSFANHLYPGLAAEKRTKDNSILSIGVCPPEMGFEEDTAIPETSPCYGSKATHQKKFIDGIIDDAGSIKYAILDGLQQKPSKAFISRLDARVTELEARGIKVIIFIPHLVINHDLKGCFARPLKNNPSKCDLPSGSRATLNENFAPLIAKITDSHPNVKFFDQNDMYCDVFGCSLIKNGMPIFRDEYNHYSEYASNELAKLFADWAETNAPGLISK